MNLVLHFLTCTSTRLFVLRFVIVASVAATVYMITTAVHGTFYKGDSVGFIVPAVVTNIHHIGSAFGPRRFPMRKWMDLPLTSLELGFYIFRIYRQMSSYQRDSPNFNYGFLPTETMMGVVSLWAVLIGLAVFLLLKITEFLATPNRSWSDTVDVARVPTTPWWRYLRFALFGRKLWDARVPGESPWIAILRGGFAMGAIGTIVAFGLQQVVILPVAENGLVPHRSFRTTTLPDVLRDAEARAYWTALVVWESRENAEKKLSQAVEFYWTFKNQEYTKESQAPCRKLDDMETACELANYTCVQSRPYYPEGLNCARLGMEFLLSIRISINFTGLFDPQLERPFGPEPASVHNAVRIYVGLAGDAQYIVETTRPVHLYPGSHLLSIADVLVRQQIHSPALATIGFETHDTFLTVEPTYTIPNPFAQEFAERTRLEMASLVITKESDKKEWIVIQDYRNKSVLGGLSGIGGLGSFLSTLLAIFLGTSLMRAVLRTKPHSPFGLLHSGMGTRLAEACRERFPALEGDVERVQREPGLIAYLLATLIDVAPIGYHDTGSKIEVRKSVNSRADVVQLPAHQEDDDERLALVPREVHTQVEEDAGVDLEKGVVAEDPGLR